jgi:type IV fimbrial biogenesis protein FimT
MLTPFHKMHGVTLIEVMAAVVIFGVLLALAAGNFSSWIQNQQTRTASESVLNGMQMARGEAVRRNVSSIFVLCDLAAGATGTSWDVLAASATAKATACGPDSTTATDWARVQQRFSQEGSRNVVAGASGVTNANAIAFNGFGRVATLPTLSLPPSTLALIQGITSVNFGNSKGNRPLSVTVTAGGSVRMCDPSPLLAATDTRHC